MTNTDQAKLPQGLFLMRSSEGCRNGLLVIGGFADLDFRFWACLVG